MVRPCSGPASKRSWQGAQSQGARHVLQARFWDRRDWYRYRQELGIYEYQKLNSEDQKTVGRHRGVITRTAESVFGALMYLTEKYGRVFPSLEGLAHLAMCCKQSVVTALADLERLGFITRIRRIRQVRTPLGFTTRQVTNAYCVQEPASGLGLLATLVFATESNCWTASAYIVESLNGTAVLDPDSPLHQALARLERAFRSRAAPVGAAKGLSM
jgi:hypothetical protein